MGKSILIAAILMFSSTATFSTRITTYSPTKRQCGSTRGITASGHKITYGMCAADWRVYPPGTIIKLNYTYTRPVSRGYSSRNYREYFVVADRGGAIKGKNKLDIALGKIHYPANTKITVVKKGINNYKKAYASVQQALKIRKVLINDKSKDYIQGLPKQQSYWIGDCYQRLLQRASETRCTVFSLW